MTICDQYAQAPTKKRQKNKQHVMGYLHALVNHKLYNLLNKLTILFFHWVSHGFGVIVIVIYKEKNITIFDKDVTHFPSYRIFLKKL